jgi:hypothetical protein
MEISPQSARQVVDFANDIRRLAHGLSALVAGGLFAGNFVAYAGRSTCVIKYRSAGNAEIGIAPLTRVENPAVLLLRGRHAKSRSLRP